jgi:hypothetical protein
VPRVHSNSLITKRSGDVRIKVPYKFSSLGVPSLRMQSTVSESVYIGVSMPLTVADAIIPTNNDGDMVTKCNPRIKSSKAEGFARG